LGIWDDQYLVRIGNDVWIGCYVVIMPGVEIGNGAIVAAGSIVTKSVPPYAIVAGNPAKIIRYRFTKEQIAELERIRWYEWDIDKVIENKSRLEGIVNFDLDNFKAAQMSKKPLIQEKHQ
jgi:carbonic anhydrase/acetyltransferase-like protein (isoleucine patch superfamily)